MSRMFGARIKSNIIGNRKRQVQWLRFDWQQRQFLPEFNSLAPSFPLSKCSRPACRKKLSQPSRRIWSQRNKVNEKFLQSNASAKQFAKQAEWQMVRAKWIYQSIHASV